MYLYVSVDAIIRSFQNAERYAEAHNRGNEGAMFKKIVRDLDSIRDIPPEAFTGMWTPEQLNPAPEAAPQEPEGAQSRVNTTESLRSAQGPAQWPGAKPLSPPEVGDQTPPPKPFVTPDLPAGVSDNASAADKQRKKAFADARQRALDEDQAGSVRNMPEVSDDDVD